MLYNFTVIYIYIYTHKHNASTHVYYIYIHIYIIYIWKPFWWFEEINAIEKQQLDIVYFEI